MVLTLCRTTGETASGLTRDPETGGGAFNQRIEMAREKADFSTGLRAMESSIRVFSRPSGFRSDQFVSDKARRSRSLALFFIAALIAVGATFAWHSQGDEAKEMVSALGLVAGLVVIDVNDEVAARTRRGLHFS